MTYDYDGVHKRATPLLIIIILVFEVGLLCFDSFRNVKAVKYNEWADQPYDQTIRLGLAEVRENYRNDEYFLRIGYAGMKDGDYGFAPIEIRESLFKAYAYSYTLYVESKHFILINKIPITIIEGTQNSMIIKIHYPHYEFDTYKFGDTFLFISILSWITWIPLMIILFPVTFAKKKIQSSCQKVSENG